MLRSEINWKLRFTPENPVKVRVRCIFGLDDPSKLRLSIKGLNCLHPYISENEVTDPLKIVVG